MASSTSDNPSSGRKKGRTKVNGVAKRVYGGCKKDCKV
jgi:hypothetical protein